MLAQQQCNAVAVVLTAEVLVEVAAAVAVVTVAAVVSVVVAAAVVTAAKAEELSVKFAEPFDGKMNKSNMKMTHLYHTQSFTLYMYYNINEQH